MCVCVCVCVCVFVCVCYEYANILCMHLCRCGSIYIYIERERVRERERKREGERECVGVYYRGLCVENTFEMFLFERVLILNRENLHKRRVLIRFYVMNFVIKSNYHSIKRIPLIDVYYNISIL